MSPSTVAAAMQGWVMQPAKLPLVAELVATGTLLLPLAGAASAATTLTSLNVSAIVVASCTIAPQLTASPDAALAASPTMCKSLAGTSIVAHRPQISIEHDAVMGVTRVIFEF